jgi:hypothetical protein
MKNHDSHNNKPIEKGILPEYHQEENPFKVPEGYFDTLQDQIMQKIHQPEKTSHRRLWIPAAVAAVLAACALMFFLLIPGHKSANEISSPVAYTYSDAVRDYLENQDIDEESIIAVMTDNQTDDINANDLINPISNDSIPGVRKTENTIQLDSTITNDDILQFLLDEGYEIDPNS